MPEDKDIEDNHALGAPMSEALKDQVLCSGRLDDRIANQSQRVQKVSRRPTKSGKTPGEVPASLR